jgi:HK97 family phage portal protein
MPRQKASATTTKRPSSRRRGKAAPEPAMVSVRGSSLWTSGGGIGSLAGGHITPEIAIRVSSIFAVCRFIGQGIGVMPIHIKQTLPNGRKVDFSPPCGYTIRKRPNPWQTSFDFMSLQGYWTALHGNGFARVLSGERGWMTTLVPMHPTRVKVEQLPDYSIRYQFLSEKGGWIPLRQEEVLHWKWMSENGLWGMAPSEVCSTSIGLARQLDVAATAYWRNGARPDFLIKTREKLDERAIDELRTMFREMYGGSNRGAPAVTTDKLDIVPMQGNSMEQSQYQQLRDAILPDICRHWGVPSTLLGDAKMARYSNPEQEHLSAQVWCMLPWQKRMEGPFDMALQPVYGEDVYVKLDSRGLLRGDNAARAALYQSMFNMGAISPNTVRDLEDFDLLDDPAADQTFMQLGFSTLSNAAAVAAAPPEGQPLEQPPADQSPADAGRGPGAGVPEAGGFREGQYVYWEGGEGTIEHLMIDGILGVEGSPFAITASEAEPAASIRLYFNGEPTEFTVGKRVSELSAEPLDQEPQP